MSGVAPLVAHGLGDAGDLPLPFDTVVLLAGGVVLATAVLVRDRRALLAEPPEPEGGRARPWLRGLVALLLAGLLVLAIAGPDDPTVSPVPRLAYGVGWPLLLLSSMLLGSWWAAASPLRLLAAALSRVTGDPEEVTVRPLPPRLGLWPAAGLLALFVWAEAVAVPRPRTVAFVLVVIALVVLAGAVRHGRAWVAHCDPFEAYSGVLGRLSPLGGGPVRLRSPRPALAAWEPPSGFVALVAVAVGADAFDGVRQLLAWQNLLVGTPPGARALVASAGLAACVATAYVLGWLATRHAPELRSALVPVAAAYAAAHHLAVAPIEAQVALGQLADPLGRGWTLFGITTSGASYDIVPGQVAALVVLATLLAGHIAAVVVANDCAAARHERAAVRAVQAPLRAVLVLSILAAVFVRFGGG